MKLVNVKYSFERQNKFIDLTHNCAHEGKLFTITRSDSSFGVGGNYDVKLNVPDTNKQYHFTSIISAKGSGVYTVYESPPNVADDGIALIVNNNNRNSSLTSGITAKHTPTVVDLGTSILYQVSLGTNFPANRLGGNTFSRNEFILKTNTSYFFRFTSDGASNVIVHTFIWYEF